MFTLLFIFLKLLSVIHWSWWWILICIALDEEGGRILIKNNESNE